MTITELTKKQGVYTNCEIKHWSAVDVGFINIHGEEDATQLNVSRGILTNEGIAQLEKLFRALCPELEVKPTSVIYVSVKASADTEEELIAMGY